MFLIRFFDEKTHVLEFHKSVNTSEDPHSNRFEN